jgi:ABC-2 type transport system permease protein
MKQFKQVLRFEYSNYVKSKPYIIITILFVVIIAGLLSYPRVSTLFKQENNQPTAEPEKIALVDHAYESEDIRLKISQAFPSYKVMATNEDTDTLKSKVGSGEYASAIILESPLKFTYMTVSMSMYENPAQVISTILKEEYQLTKIEELGLTREEAQSLINPVIDSTITETGKSQAESFIYTYILIISLYMAIMLYGQFVATGVASEKSSRAMELLITSAKPMSLLFGKVIGTGLAGLTQFGIIFGSAFLFYNINADIWANNSVIQRIFNIPLDMFLYVLLFFVIGFFLYAFLYGALGSLVSRSEDVGTAIMPLTFVTMAAYFVVIISMSSGKIDSPLMVICSYIPFTSPFVMFTRIAMSSVPPLEIIVSLSIAIASTIGIGILAAAIYRIGILMYGKPPKLGVLIKTIRKQKVKA